MRAPSCAILLAVWAMLGAAETAAEEDFLELGYREDTLIQTAVHESCFGELICNHDGAFENAYCWQYGGVAPPYAGAWGEAFDLGSVTVECGVYWFTQVGGYWGLPVDFYVWDGGVWSHPACVLDMLSVAGISASYWPSCTRNDIEIGCCVMGDFTVGFWTDWSGGLCEYYCAADENGGGGHPWTCIAPGIGYPTGWRHVAVVHPRCKSMGIGVTVTGHPSPAASETWGRIKTLFR